MPQIAAKSRQSKPTRRGSYIPAPVRKRVVGLHVAGESNRCIAITEGIDRGTVSRILSQKEVVQRIARYQATILAIVPKAIRVVEAALSSPDQRIRMQAAVKVLEGTGVLNRGGIEQAIAIASQASSPTHGDERVHAILGQIIEMTIRKHQTHNIALPDEMIRLLPAAGAPLRGLLARGCSEVPQARNTAHQ
jgi:hypothetical protein